MGLGFGKVANFTQFSFIVKIEIIKEMAALKNDIEAQNVYWDAKLWQSWNEYAYYPLI